MGECAQVRGGEPTALPTAGKVDQCARASKGETALDLARGAKNEVAIELLSAAMKRR